MKLLQLLKSETSRLLIAGFVIGSIGLAAAQPGTAQTDGSAATLSAASQP